MKDLSSNPLTNINTVSSTYARLDSTPTLDETFFSTTYTEGHNVALTSNQNIHIFVAPFAVKLTGVWLVWFGRGTESGGNGTNSLKISIDKWTNQGTGVHYTGTIVTGSTNSSSADYFGQMTTTGSDRVVKTLNASNFSATYSILAAGDSVTMQHAKTGTWTMPNGPLSITVRYLIL